MTKQGLAEWEIDVADWGIEYGLLILECITKLIFLYGVQGKLMNSMQSGDGEYPPTKTVR